jgi:nitroreductase
MDFFDVVGKRRSIRAYKPDPVEAEKVDRILETANLAPTAADKQPVRVVVVETRGREAELGKVYDKAWFAAAPLVLAVFALPSESWKRSDGTNYAEVDASIVMDHVVLAATALGLGSCWIGAFDPAAARAALGQEGWNPVALTPLGYPAEAPDPRPRKGARGISVRK